MKFKRGYVNGIAGWIFSRAEIEQAEENRKMLMLDFEWGKKCSLNCGYCFRREDVRDRGLPVINLKQAFGIIDQAKDLGCKSIHFVGQGEPLEDEDFLKVVENVYEADMIPLFFTAGHVLGDDRLAKQIHKMSGTKLAELLYELRTSIIVKVNSLRNELQNKIVGCPKYYFEGKEMRLHSTTGEAYDFTRFNKICLERLIREGFNKSNPTRLGADILVLGKNYRNYDEIFDMYVHFRNLNIYPAVVTFIPCGRTTFEDQRDNFDVSQEEKIELWKSIYKWNLDHGIEYDGVSAFAGGHVCKQRTFALYVNVRGEVYTCPGEYLENRLGSLVGPRHRKLKDIWDDKLERIRRDKKEREKNSLICKPRIQSGSLPKNLKEEVGKYVRSLHKK